MVDFGVGLCALAQARFKGFDLVIVAGELFCLGSRFLGVLVVGLNVLGHDFGLF